MRFYNNLCGQDAPNIIYKYLPNVDSKTAFIENLKTQSEDWPYRTIDIEYSYNNYGHRSKNIHDIKLDNYILYIGCSHTEGVGVRLEDSYPYITSSQMNCDYYNLAIGGTGIDIIEYNLITWFTTIKQKPKYVVIQWPDHSRFISISAYPGYERLIPNGSWAEDNYTKRFLSSGEATGFFNARKHISYKLIKEIVDVPIVDVHFTSLASYSNDSTLFRRIDLGRDLAHSGIKSHQAIANQIIAYIKSLK